jgi:hypothetical protein
MKTRTHFAHRIDMLDAAGEIQEHLAGVEDYMLAEAVWRESVDTRVRGDTRGHDGGVRQFSVFAQFVTAITGSG